LDSRAQLWSTPPARTRLVVFDDDGGCTVDADILAPALGLSPASLIDQLRAGLVYQINERGIGADEGLTRLTFRYRHREFRAIVDGAGRITGPREASCG